MDIQPLHPLVVQLFTIGANCAACIGVGVAIAAGYIAYTSWQQAFLQAKPDARQK